MVAALAALLSAAAASIALYYNHIQAKVFERDFVLRNLADSNNSINLSRYYKELLSQLLDDIDSNIDHISVCKKIVGDKKEDFIGLFDEIEAPKYLISDYHLINYKPASAYNIIKSKRKIDDLKIIIENYKNVMPGLLKEGGFSDIEDVLDTIEGECKDVKSLTMAGLKNLSSDIRVTEQEIESMEKRIKKLAGDEIS